MPKNKIGKSNQLTLAIHSTEDSFGCIKGRNDNKSDKYFVKNFEKDLCNIFIVVQIY